MVVINTIHSLTEEELSLLNSLIGVELVSIYSSGINLWSSLNTYQFDNSINLNLGKRAEYISIAADFDETRFGDDFIKIEIEQTKIPKGINTENGVFREPNACLILSPIFTISSIEIYGFSYQTRSENLKPDSIWIIEKENPGQPIEENIETENILLFHSTDGRLLLIEPVGALPWIQVKVGDHMIDPIHNGLSGEPLTKLKRTIK